MDKRVVEQAGCDGLPIALAELGTTSPVAQFLAQVRMLEDQSEALR